VKPIEARHAVQSVAARHAVKARLTRQTVSPVEARQPGQARLTFGPARAGWPNGAPVTPTAFFTDETHSSIFAFLPLPADLPSLQEISMNFVFYTIIDGQVCLVSLVRLARLQTVNSRLFLHQQTDKRQSYVRLHNQQTVNGLRKLAWASVFRLIFVW
jgi:hypothetical protein